MQTKKKNTTESKSRTTEQESALKELFVDSLKDITGQKNTWLRTLKSYPRPLRPTN